MAASRTAGAPPVASLPREVVGLAWPAILQGLLHTTVFLADRLMLGAYGETALASMQVSGPAVWSLVSIFTAFAAGTVAVVGRAAGAGDALRAQRTVRGVMALSLGLGLGVGALGFFGREEIALILAGGDAGTAEIRLLAGRYLAILMPVAALDFLGVTATAVLQASGDTRTPMLVFAGAGALNVLGNWVFIFGHLGAPELGVAGAALGTAIAFAAEGVALTALLLRRADPVRLVLGPLDRHVRRELRAVLRVSRAAFAEKLIFHAGFLVFVGLIGRLGDVAMAANQALIAIESLGFITADGFGVAAGALVAMKLGAGRPAEAARAGWLAAGLGVGVLCGVGLLFALFRTPLVGLFSDDPEILRLGATCLLVAAVAQPLMAVADALAAALRGAGDTRTPMVTALVAAGLLRNLATYLLAFPLGLGLLGVWLGSTADWLLRATVLTWVFARGRWQRIRV
ncbi:MAG: MATE family efflux transporter [Deltaproteobacteria bacterium]|nr:MAG: MATE family efflux transporter [Deltaproteobacteria bacterium]